MKIKETEYYTQLTSKDSNGIFIIEIQNDCSQIRVETDDSNLSIDTNYKELVIIKEQIEKILNAIVKPKSIKKTSIQIFADMHQDDCDNGTRFIEVSPTFVSGKIVKQGSLITMGSDQSTFNKIINEKSLPLLVIYDKEEYRKRIS